MPDHRHPDVTRRSDQNHSFTPLISGNHSNGGTALVNGTGDHLRSDGCTRDRVNRRTSASRLGNFVLTMFSIVLIGSGSAILTTILMYGSAASPAIRFSILSPVHPLNLMMYSLFLSTIIMFLIAIVNFCSTCCSSTKTPPTETYHVVGNSYPPEAVTIPLKRLGDDSDIDIEFSTDCSLPSSRADVQTPHMPTSTRSCNGHCRATASPRSLQTHRSESSTSRVSPVSFCYLIFVMLFLMTLQLTTTFIGFVSYSNIESLVTDNNNFSLSDSFHIHSSESVIGFINSHRAAFDRIESTFRCCGLHDYEDYATQKAVPQSCCKSKTPGCGSRRHPSNIFDSGCYRPVLKSMSEELRTLSFLSLGFAALFAFGLLISCTFYVKLISEPRSVRI